MRDRRNVDRLAAPLILIAALVVFFTLVFSAMAEAQAPSHERERMERWFMRGYDAWDMAYLRADDLSFNQLVVERVWMRRPGDRFQRLSHQSHFSTLPLAAVARFGPGHDTEFRFRAGLVTPISSGHLSPPESR